MLKQTDKNKKGMNFELCEMFTVLPTYFLLALGNGLHNR